jgi:hypothetical protein
MTVSDEGGGDVSRAGSEALALALPPIMPSFPGRLALTAAGAGVSSGDTEGCWDFRESRVCAGGEGVRKGEGSFGCFFLPPITPNPPFGLFGASRTCAGGEGGGWGDGEGWRSISFLLLPPILPSPPFDSFGAS